MAIHYYCRHCSSKIGTIDQPSFDSGKLGLEALTDEEKQEMVSYGSEGDVHIKAICEDCHANLLQNPELHQYSHLIH